MNTLHHLLLKASIALILLCSMNFSVGAQSFKIVNNSGMTVSFQILASDQNKCNLKYRSSSTGVNASSTIEYKQPSEISWLVENNPLQGELTPLLSYSELSISCSNASGDHTAYASNFLGTSNCKTLKSATLDATKCGGKGLLHLSWSEENGNVLITIK